MKLKCPACGAVASLDVLIANEGAREAVLTALQLPAPLGKLLIQYLGLFRPAARELSFDRVNTILSELLPAVRDNTFTRNGRVWVVPKECWADGIQQMLMQRDAGKLSLPLKTHGYLYEVVMGMADRAEAKAEQRTEEHRQRGGDAWRSNTGLVGAGEMAAALDAKQGAPPAEVAKPRKPMPDAVRQALKPQQG